MKSTIHIGDIVKITKPDLFIRCGYPLTKEDVKKQYIDRNEVEEAIISLLKSKDKFTFDDYHVEKIVNELAFLKLRSLGFGGRKRSIYTENNPEFQDKIYIVAGKKTVVTGEYQYGGGSSYYDDYESPMLINQKRHVILYLDRIIYDRDYYPKAEYSFEHPYSSDETIMIEKSNVVKLENQEQTNEYDPFQFHTYRVDKIDISKGYKK